MEKTKLEKALEFIEDCGKTMFEKDGGLNPLLFVFGETKKDYVGEDVDVLKKDKGVVLSPIPNEFVENRDRFVYLYGKFLFTKLNDKTFPLKRVDVFGMANEGWVSVMSKEDSKKIDKGEMEIPKPSLDPNRKEVLVFTVLNENRESRMISYEIVTEKGKKILKNFPNFSKTKGKDKDMKVEANLLSRFWEGFLPTISMF